MLVVSRERPTAGSGPRLLDDEADNLARYERIVAMHRAGGSYEAIAAEYGLTRQRVAQIITGGPPRHWRGPGHRLRRDVEPLPPDPEHVREGKDLRDPAAGAKVARCGACGMPGSVDLVGRWGGPAGEVVRFPVCDHCLRRFNPRPDPLTVL